VGAHAKAQSRQVRKADKEISFCESLLPGVFNAIKAHGWKEANRGYQSQGVRGAAQGASRYAFLRLTLISS